MLKDKSKYKCYPNCDLCCRMTKYTTYEEFKLAFEALQKQGIFLRVARMPKNRYLWPSPCPALDTSKPFAKCRIYEVRPFPCRGFLCGKASEDDKRPFYEDGNYKYEYLLKLLKEDKEFAQVKKEYEDESMITWGKKFGYDLEEVKTK